MGPAFAIIIRKWKSPTHAVHCRREHPTPRHYPQFEVTPCSISSRNVQRRAGGLFIIAAALLWSSLGVAGRFAFRAGVVPLEAAFYRAAISFACLLIFLVATNHRALRIRPRDLGLFAAFGFFGVAAFFVAYMTAINATTVATAAILLYTAPAFVIVLSAVLFGETLTIRKAVAVACAFIGCVLVGRGYDLSSLRLNLPGVLAGLVSGLAYALYTVFGKTAVRQYAPLTTLTYALGFGTIFLGTLALATGVIPRAHPASGWMAVIYLALVTTLLAQALYLAGLRFIDAGPASLLATAEPVAAAVLGYIVLGERLEGLQIAGGVLVVGAVMLARGRTGPKNES
jgi:drug/metabolite transporter, DME family